MTTPAALPPAADCTCGARIRWVALLPALKPHPIESDPMPDGTIDLIDGQKHRGLPVAAVLPSRLRFGKPFLFSSHFASCPAADTYRSTGPRRAARPAPATDTGQMDLLDAMFDGQNGAGQ